MFIEPADFCWRGLDFVCANPLKQLISTFSVVLVYYRLLSLASALFSRYRYCIISTENETSLCPGYVVAIA